MSKRIRSVLKVGLPVSLMSGGFVLMGAVDVAMVAPLGRRSLAALGLANVYATTVLSLLNNFLAPVSVLVSRLRGAKDPEGVASVYRNSIALAVLVAIPTTLLLLVPEQALHLLAGAKQPPEIVQEAVTYSRALAWGAPAATLFLATANFVEGHKHMWAGVVVLGIANVVNLVGNAALIYGKWGLPAYGSAGSAYATSIVRWVTLVGIVVYIVAKRELRDAADHRKLFRFELSRIRQIAALGLPLGMRTGARQLFYATLTAIVARFGDAALAANQVAMSLFVVANVFHAGFAAGVAVIIAEHVGRKDGHEARRAMRIAATIGAIASTVTALVLIVFASAIARKYTDDVDVATVCADILRVCAIAHVSTAVALSFVGGMMATLDTKYLARASIPLQFLVGLPCAWLLAKGLHLGPAATWSGPAISELLMTIVLMRRFREKTEFA